MADLLAMRETLRRRLKEAVEEQWSDTVLNSYLNVGLSRVQADILAIDRQAFIYVDHADIVSGQARYAKPIGFYYEILFKLLTDDEYTAIRKIDYRQLQKFSDSETQCYAHFGRWFQIGPVPTASVPAGIELEYVPLLVMADDADVPQVNVELHHVIVKYAEVEALGETSEVGERAMAEIVAIRERLPLYFTPSGADSPSVIIDIDKGY